jgi:tetratricopeptide (TPR) repeat protein
MSPALPPSARKEFERAVALFNQGRLDTADGICSELISRFPDDADIAHFGGVLANRMGRYDVAVQRLDRSLSVRPGRARALAALGFAHQRLGQVADAQRAFEGAIQADPGFSEAYNGLGAVLVAAGRNDVALQMFERAIAIDPASAEARLNSARVLQEGGRVAPAAQRFREALNAASGRIQVMRACALGLQQVGDLPGALQAFRVLAAADPGDAITRARLAFALEASGLSDEAWNEMEAAVAAGDAHAEVHNLRGILLMHRERLEEAATSFRSAAALDPAIGEAQVNLANVLARMGMQDAALAAIDAAKSRVSDAPTLARLAGMLGELGQGEEAIAIAGRAIEAAPALPDAHAALAFELLRAGDLERGWREHAYRPTRGIAIFEAISRGEYPPSLPEPIAGRDVLLVAEQGLGDVLFFLRFAAPLAAAGARLHVKDLDPRLLPLVQRALPVTPWDGLHPPAAGLLSLWVGDLPRFAWPRGGEEPLALTALDDRVARMRERLGPASRRRIGLAWQAGTRGGFAAGGQSVLMKNIEPRGLGETLAGLDCEFISLQRDPAEGSLASLEEALGAAVADMSSANADLEDMLALLSLLDDYVGVSSTNVHLRAGLGLAGRILVPFPPEWRWGAAGRSRWFAEFETYRQRNDGDWSGALGALRSDLEAEAAK